MKKVLMKCMALLLITNVVAQEKPNVVIVIADDQGYGDLGCHGHPYAKTPNVDMLSKESVNLSDFHVFPTCSPTRAALMTGHWANRTGVWHTINGRSLIRKNEVVVASMLQKAGYETGIFGKWHLGDAYPFRPQDRGFKQVYVHGAGGVGQTPDVWNNSYFDDSYLHNGKIEQAKGFCTDVFFEKGNAFIKKCVEEKKPFFTYISLNAPHGPMLCPQKYLNMYEGKPGRQAAFYGMITNIDDNVGKTRQLLKHLGVEKNTIFVFMTDNGSASGWKVFNAGMKGGKNSEYDGGHRVPFIVHYPKGKMTGGRIVKTLTHVVDIAPTLLEVCGAEKPDHVKFDGQSIRGLLDGSLEKLPHRYLITDSQRVIDPIKWRKSAVMTQDWRLVNGKELYYLPDDPGQKNNLAKKNPDKVKEMRGYYDEWWTELEPTYKETAEFIIGSENCPKVLLTAHDWISPKYPPWNQKSIRGLDKFVTKEYKGYWAVDAEKAGSYKVGLYRWAPEANLGITAGVKAEADEPGIDKPFCAHKGVALDIVKAHLYSDGKHLGSTEVKVGDVKIDFNVDFKEGEQKVKAYFELKNGKQVGVTYATFELNK